MKHIFTCLGIPFKDKERQCSTPAVSVFVCWMNENCSVERLAKDGVDYHFVSRHMMEEMIADGVPSM